jgi:hypothetical protein
MLKYSRKQESTNIKEFLQAANKSLSKYDTPNRLQKDFFTNVEDMNVKEMEQ